MNREFEKGDRIMCINTGVVGICVDFYTPTGCEEQTMVSTDDGRRYHAPTREWVVTAKVNPRGYEGEEKVNTQVSSLYDKYDAPLLDDYPQSMIETVLSAYLRMGHS